MGVAGEVQAAAPMVANQVSEMAGAKEEETKSCRQRGRRQYPSGRCQERRAPMEPCNHQPARRRCHWHRWPHPMAAVSAGWRLQEGQMRKRSSSAPQLPGSSSLWRRCLSSGGLHPHRRDLALRLQACSGRTGARYCGMRCRRAACTVGGSRARHLYHPPQTQKSGRLRRRGQPRQSSRGR